MTAFVAMAPAAALGTVLDRTVLSDPKYDASQQVVAVNPSQAVAVAWRERRGDDWIVRAAMRAPGGDWGASETLSLPGGDAEDVQVAIGADGTAAVAWQRVEGGRVAAQAAVRPAGAPWTAGKTLSAAAVDGFHARVGIDGSGNVTVVWTESDGRNLIVRSGLRARGGDWGAAVDVSEPGRSAFDPQVVVTSDGTAMALWRRFNGVSSQVQSALRTAGAPWAAPENLSAPGGHALQPRLVITGEGLAVAAWRRFNGSIFVVQATSRTALRGWARARDVSRAVGANDLSVASAGKIAVLEWSERRDGWRAVIAEDGTILEPTTVSEPRSIGRAADGSGGLFRATPGFTYFPASVSYEASGADDSAAVGNLGKPCAPAPGDDLTVVCVPTSVPRLVALDEGCVLALYLAMADTRDSVEAATVNSVPLPPEPDDLSLTDPSLDDPSREASFDRGLTRIEVGSTGLATVPVRCDGTRACEGRIMLRVALPAPRKGGQRQAARVRPVAVARFRLVAGAKWGVVMRVSPRMRAHLARSGEARAGLVFRATSLSGRPVTQRRVVTLYRSAGTGR